MCGVTMEQAVRAVLLARKMPLARYTRAVMEGGISQVNKCRRCGA